MLIRLNSATGIIGSGYYKNPWILTSDRLLSMIHLPYAVLHVLLSVLLGVLLLNLAGYFLFRSSREDHP